MTSRALRLVCIVVLLGMVCAANPLIHAPAASGGLNTSQLFVPVALSSYPQPPSAPVLALIDNADGDGDYTVSWSAPPGAAGYLLQEDDSPAFPAPTAAYSGTAASTLLTGRPPGTHYYRVRAHNSAGASPWSNTRPVTVTAAWTTILYTDFEGDFPGPWTVSDYNSNNGLHYWGKRSCRPFAGAFSGWAVGGGPDGAALECGSVYPLRVAAWLVYGPFSLADSAAAELTLKLWLNTEPVYDGVFVGASADGSNYQGSTYTGSSGGWTDVSLNLAAVPSLGSLLGDGSVWVAVVFTSDQSTVLSEGAYIDDITLRKRSGAPGGMPVAAASQLPAGIDVRLARMTLVPERE